MKRRDKRNSWRGLFHLLTQNFLRTIFILPKISESCRVNGRYTETVIHWVSNETWKGDDMSSNNYNRASPRRAWTTDHLLSSAPSQINREFPSPRWMDAFFPQFWIPSSCGFGNLDPRAWQVRGSLITRRIGERNKGGSRLREGWGPPVGWRRRVEA